MKFSAFIFAAAALLAADASAQVPVVLSARNIEIDKIVSEEIQTPKFSIDVGDKRVDPLKWLEIEVEFTVKGVALVDELTFKYAAVINGKIYPGEVTHVNIPEGRGRYSVMYISPRALERAATPKKFAKTMVDNIKVEVSKQGVILGTKYLNMKQAIPNAQQFPGFLVQKSETPFHVLWWDRYEAAKVAPAR